LRNLAAFTNLRFNNSSKFHNNKTRFLRMKLRSLKMILSKSLSISNKLKNWLRNNK